MINKISFFSVIAFIILSLGLFSSVVYATEKSDIVGKVITAIGQAKATTVDKKERDLKRGDPIYQGDIVFTDEHSQVQLRFTDGTILSLRAASRYHIEEYKYQDEASKDQKFFARLVSGGFRTVTGAIGKENHQEYRVTTPVSMIGIRGTDYTAVLENHMLYVAVGKGAVVLANDKGEMLIGDGAKHQFGIVTSANEKPRGLNSMPAAIRTCRFERKPL